MLIPVEFLRLDARFFILVHISIHVQLLLYRWIDELLYKKLFDKSPHISIHDIHGKDKLTIYLRTLKAFQIPCMFPKWSECILCFKWLIFHIPYFKRPKSFVISMKRWEKRQKTVFFIYSRPQTNLYISKINTFFLLFIQ